MMPTVLCLTTKVSHGESSAARLRSVTGVTLVTICVMRVILARNDRFFTDRIRTPITAQAARPDAWLGAFFT